MKDSIKINDFRFERAGHGHYLVVYTSPATGKKWRVVTHDMPLIDATHNAVKPTKKDLHRLKNVCKTGAY